nr:putative reverse transcriptase domain-containing protein [Tanacetum cinerariifolium]
MDLMPIELGTFDVIIGMDWLVKHDAIIVCGKKVVRIPYGNEMLIFESDKDVEEHEKHLKIILELLKKERFGVHVDAAKIKSIKGWAVLTTPMEVRQFIGLAGYYTLVTYGHVREFVATSIEKE